MKVSAKHYVVLFSASIGSLFAGSQLMHAILKPDLTIPDLTATATGDEKEERPPPVAASTA